VFGTFQLPFCFPFLSHFLPPFHKKNGNEKLKSLVGLKKTADQRPDKVSGSGLFHPILGLGRAKFAFSPNFSGIFGLQLSQAQLPSFGF